MKDRDLESDVPIDEEFLRRYEANLKQANKVFEAAYTIAQQ